MGKITEMEINFVIFAGIEALEKRVEVLEAGLRLILTGKIK
jgi:hypothetical protein